MRRDDIPPRSVLEAKKRLSDAVRRFFDQRGLLEVETPIAVLSPGIEPHLEPFETEERGPDDTRTRLFLHTSPEYAMKRLLARGLGSIYQLARVFRNGERSATHAPEFTMLEWYRHPGSLEELETDVAELLAEAADAVSGPWRPAGVERLDVSTAFRRVGLGDPLEALDDHRALCQRLQMAEIPGDDWTATFFRAWLERVEPSFDENRITVVHGWPATMAALAELDEADPRRAKRFEVYLGRLELANAFAELSCPIEQRRRFDADLAYRKRNGLCTPPIDEALLADLPKIAGAAGIALGLDRLLMRCLGLRAVQDVLPFSPRDPD